MDHTELAAPEGPSATELIRALRAYRDARRAFLAALGCAGSNRDPFAESSERIAHAVLGGSLAASRTQKGWDLRDPGNRRVQVRYLANPDGRWVNEHLVDFRDDGCDRYALVVFEGLDLKCMLVFDADQMEAVGAAFGKRHPGQDRMLALTQANYRILLADPDRFASLGVQFFELGELGQ
jgi:hypothetical protein